MKFTKIALTLACTTILFCGCAKNSDVVLRVNDQDITRKEFYGDLNKIRNVQFKGAPREIKKETSYASLTLKDRFVSDIIVRTVLQQEFEKRDIQATEEEIKGKQAIIMAQLGSEAEFKNRLKENGISQERLHSDIANEVKVEKLVKSITNNISVSDKDIEKFYKENKDQFSTPERVQVSHILIDTNPDNIKRSLTDADKEGKMSSADIDSKVKEEVKRKEALANEVRLKASKNPKQFAELAKQYSEDEASAKNGGDLGFVTKDAVVEEFAKAAFNQKVGVVGPLVKSQFGYHIILVRDKAAGGVQPLSSVKNDLKSYLTEQKKFETFQKFVTGLKDSAKVEYVDESLKPDVIKNQLEEALAEQKKFEEQSKLPKAKVKALEKLKKENKEEK